MSIESSFIRIYDGNPKSGGSFAGTAFFIAPQRLLTAAHVVRDCRNGVFLHGLPDDCAQVDADSISYCPEIGQWTPDVALLHCAKPQDVFPISPASYPPKVKEPVLVCGFNNGGGDNTLHQRPTSIAGYIGLYNCWSVADGVHRGMSGGAVLRDGELIGVVYGRDKDAPITAYFVPIDVLHIWLGDSFITPFTTPIITHPTEQTRAREVFVGREDELTQLRQRLLSGDTTPIAITALHGMAGVGKSWLVDHFYAVHEAQFPGGYLRLTLDAENPASAELMLAELGDRCELPVPVHALAKHLNIRLNSPRTLVHIENLDSPQAVQNASQLCHQLVDCPIVLSGRIENFGRNQRWQQISLKPFVTAQALAQLQTELDWSGGELPDETTAIQLVHTLGGLPLAIHLAAGYLAQPGYTAQEFLDNLRLTDYKLPPADSTDTLLNRDAAKAILDSTFRLSLRVLAQQATLYKISEANQLITYLGFAPLSGFGLSMAQNLLAMDAPLCQSLLRLAQNLSLIDSTQTQTQTQTQTPRWQLHPLFASYLRQLTTDPDTAEERLAGWFLQRLPEPSKLEKDLQHGWHELNQESSALTEWLASLPEKLQYPVERAGSQYALRNGPFLNWMVFCEQALNNPEHNEQQRSDILFTLMQVAQSSGNNDKAIRYAEEKYQLDIQRDDKRGAALARGQIADILQARGNLDEALRIRTEDQLPVYESLGEVRSIAITKGKIADILQARGNLDEALRIRQQEELPVYESLGEVRSIAITKGKIADILQARGNLDEALRIRQQEELPVYESLGEVRSIAITKGKIADILQARGNLDEALRIRTEDQLPVYESLGEVRSIAITKGKIADILQARGNLDEALRIRTEDQLPVYESLGEVRSIAITKGKIADILQARGNLDEALRIRTEDQLPVYESLGEVRSIAITKGKIADILQARGNLDEALRIRQQEELPVYESLGEVRSIAITKGKIADILQARGNLDEALRIRTEDQLPVYESLGEVRSIAITKGKIADILQARGNLDEALRIRTEDQLPVYESLGEVRSIAITKGKIADILQARGNLDEALRIRQQEELPVYESLGEVRSIAITKGKIADILQARGNLDEALRIRQQEELPVYESLGEVRSIAITKGKIADILQARGNLDEALRIRQQEELPVYESLGEVREIAITKGQIADILQARGNLDEALRIRTEDQLPVYESLGEVREIAITKGKIADILQARGNLDEALRIRTEDQLPVYESLGEVRSIAITKGKIADILFLNEKHDEAFALRENEVLPILEQLGDKRGLLVDQANLAIQYLRTENSHERAAELLLSAYQAAVEMQIPEAEQVKGILAQLGVNQDKAPS